MNHCSTIEEQIHMISQIVAQPSHGLVSQLSCVHQVSRQTLYRWSAIGSQARQETLGTYIGPTKRTPSVPILVLTLLIETHASYRGIQSTLRSQHGIEIGLGTIAGVVKEAGQRTQNWMKQQSTGTIYALTLDEQYSNQRGKASLSVIDVHNGQVWMNIPPVQADGESWIVLLWYLHEQGITSLSTVSDEGRAIQEAVSQVDESATHQQDARHLFLVVAQVQGRLNRAMKTEYDRLQVIQRQAEREVERKRGRERPAKAILAEQQALMTQMGYVAEGIHYLCQQLHTLLEGVVLHCGHVLGSDHHQGVIEAVLDLLNEVVPLTIPALQEQIYMLCKHLRLALSQTLSFSRLLDARQEHASCDLGLKAVALLAWAWMRRTLLGPTSKDLLQRIPPDWQVTDSNLLSAWAQAIRASSIVENWHSIVQPHLAVHRTLSAGMTALLVVWHNHQIAPRGLHEGLSYLLYNGQDHLYPRECN